MYDSTSLSVVCFYFFCVFISFSAIRHVHCFILIHVFPEWKVDIPSEDCPSSDYGTKVGCFVPAEYACFRLANQIFSHIGCNDDMEGNASVFMVGVSFHGPS